MSQATHSRSGSLTPFLAGAALVMASYLVLDRVGTFDPGPDLTPKAVVPRGELASWEKTSIEIFKQNSPSAVHITVGYPGAGDAEMFQQISSGSGVVWDAQGYILTNYHVVAEARPRIDGSEARLYVRLHDDRLFRGHFVGGYEYADLACIRIEDAPRNLVPARAGKSGDLQVGQAVFAIGNPFGLDQTLTSGIISALDRTITTGPASQDVELSGLIQVDAAINPGNSGGLLLDSAGLLIGMNTAIASKTGEFSGIGFAVPIDRIRMLMPRLMQERPPVKAGLGIWAANRPINPRDRRPVSFGADLEFGWGIGIRNLAPDGGAAKAGLQPFRQRGPGDFVGDVIVSFGGVRVRSINALYRELEKYSAGDKVPVVVARFLGGGRYRQEKAQVTLGSLDSLPVNRDR